MSTYVIRPVLTVPVKNGEKFTETSIARVSAKSAGRPRPIDTDTLRRKRDTLAKLGEFHRDRAAMRAQMRAAAAIASLVLANRIAIQNQNLARLFYDLARCTPEGVFERGHPQSIEWLKVNVLARENYRHRY